jgi:HK97 family phage major capsid protein
MQHMDTFYTPPARTVDEHTRRTIARELSRYYDELSGNAETPPPRFSLARVVESMLHERGLADGREREVCSAAAMSNGETFDPHRVLLPLQALATRRDLTAAGVGGSNYLVSTDTGAPVDLLAPWSVAAAAGVTVLPNLQGNLVLPRVTAGASGAWVSGENVAYNESQPTVGQASLTPKHAAVWLKFSRQWRLQSDGGEEFLRRQLMRAVGEMVDRAFFSGSGASGEPSGLLLASGIGTQSGTSLAHAGVLAMRDTALDAGAREEALRWVGHPGVQQTLGARERSSGGGRFLWDDDGILGKPAHATKNAPASTLVCGDFSAAVLGLWGPTVRLEINPYQDFKAGIYAARVVLTCDVAFPQPSAFVVAPSIT